MAPWWTFPFSTLAGGATLGGGLVPALSLPVWGLAAWVVLFGTVVPFSLVVFSMQHLRASQASVVGMTEPIIATFIAWVALGEVLAPAQLVGAVVVLGGILLAERSRR